MSYSHIDFEGRVEDETLSIVVHEPPWAEHLVATPGDYVDEQDRCWGTGNHGGPCPHRAETDVGLCLDCRDEIKARVDE